MKDQDERPYIVKTYDRWIILVIVLVAGWLLFRPLFAFSVYYRGLSFEHMLRMSTAEHYYRKAIAVDPKVPEGWVGLGELSMLTARIDRSTYAQAVNIFKQGLGYNPSSGGLAFDLCRTYYEIGKEYENARVACDLATRNQPTNPFTWDYAAWANLRTGNKQQALADWREAQKRGHTGAYRPLKLYGGS